MLIYIIVIVLVLVAAAYFWFVRSARRSGLKRMAAGVDIVKSGIAVELLRRYKLKYDDKTAVKLGVAVANELFSDPPGTSEAVAFLSENRGLVHDRMRELAEDGQTREALTQALRVKAMVALAQGKRDRAHLIEPIEKVKELGLLIPGGDTPSADTFFPLVQRYYRLIKPDG